jgi:Glycosyltransferase
LLAAAARWSHRDPAPMVIVVGAGPLEARIRAAIDRLGAPVRLLGQRDDVAELMSAADLVVLPSRWEARSLVAQEALHAGRPLVATAVGGLPELLGDGAVLVPPGDVDAFDQAVRRLLDNPDQAGEVAARGRQRARTWPTEDDTATQVRAVYAELLGVGG